MSNDAQNYKFIAEEHFKANKFQKAIECAEMAKSFDRNLHEIDNHIAAYKVHKSAQKKRWNGEPDWYKVLGIDDRSPNFHIVKSQFNKLIMMVHPDKNHSVAANGASVLVNQAWKALKGNVDSVSSSQAKGFKYYSGTSQTSSNTTSETSSGTDPNKMARDSKSGYSCPKCEQFKGFSKPLFVKITCPHCGSTYKNSSVSM